MTGFPIDPSDVGALRLLRTIETSERLAAKAYEAIREGRPADAAFLLQVLAETTSTTTMSAVKDQDMSDGIASVAAGRVRKALADLEADKAAREADRLPKVVSDAVLTHYQGAGNVSALARTIQAIRVEFPAMTVGQSVNAIREHLAAHGLQGGLPVLPSTVQS